MPADGKWVEGLTAQMKWAEAGERILAARLDAVENNWRWALEETVDPEAVHQLRVSTRRARAAVDIYTNILQKGVVRDLAQLLKKLRNVVGPARDWDVFLLHVTDWSANRPDSEHPGLDVLIGSALMLRSSCQEALRRSERWRATWNDLRKKVVPRRGYRQRLGPQAERLVNVMVAAFQTAINVDNPNGEELHQVRIAGKRLRYGLELFVDVLNPVIRESWLPLMEDLQEALGAANDARNLLTHIEQMSQALPRLGADRQNRLAVGINAWRDQLTSQANNSNEQFLEWRSRWRATVEPSLGEIA